MDSKLSTEFILGVLVSKSRKDLSVFLRGMKMHHRNSCRRYTDPSNPSSPTARSSRCSRTRSRSVCCSPPSHAYVGPVAIPALTRKVLIRGPSWTYMHVEKMYGGRGRWEGRNERGGKSGGREGEEGSSGGDDAIAYTKMPEPKVSWSPPFSNANLSTGLRIGELMRRVDHGRLLDLLYSVGFAYLS